MNIISSVLLIVFRSLYLEVRIKRALIATGRAAENHKKTDVADHPEVISHVGLLFNEPLGRAGLLFI